jgi:hypothetical protein
MRRTVFSGIVGAVLLVAFNSTSAFAAATSDTAAPTDAPSASTAATTAAPPADAASTAQPTPTPSFAAPTTDGAKSAAPAPQAASDAQVAADATTIALEEHPEAPQPPLIDGNGQPYLGTGLAGTPDGVGAVSYGGGSVTGATSSAASWLWDGTSWSQVCAACPPGARGFSGMATAPSGVVLYGGVPSFSDPGLPDAWVFADGAWTQLCATCPPGARLGVAMAGGGPGGEVLMFGGASDFSGSPGTGFNDTWGFDGLTWTQLDSGVPGDPVARIGASMAWDGTRFILFGGSPLVSGLGVGPAIDDGTWVWTGDHWTQLCASAVACGPAPRTVAHLAALSSPDPSRRGVLLVGGVTADSEPMVFGDIWLWHDGQWIQQASPWLDQQSGVSPTGPLLVVAGLASRAAVCGVSLLGATNATTATTFNLGLDTNGDGVIDPCPVVPPPTPPAPTPENVVAPAAATPGAEAEATAAGTLPFTGSDLAGPMTFATALLCVGLILVACNRRKRVRRSAHSQWRG